MLLKKTHSIARAGKKGIRSIPNTRQNSCQTYHNNIKINLWYLCTCNSNIFNLEQSHLHNFDISTAFSSDLGGFVLCHQLDVGRLRFDMSSWKHKFHGRVCTLFALSIPYGWHSCELCNCPSDKVMSYLKFSTSEKNWLWVSTGNHMISHLESTGQRSAART